MKTTIHTLSAAIVLSAVTLTVEAETSTQTFAFGTTLLGQTALLTTPIAFNKFNPALGTLTGVTWTVSGNINYLARARGGPQVSDPETGELTNTYRNVLWNTAAVVMRDTAQADVAGLSINPQLRQLFLDMPPNVTTAGFPGLQLFFQTPFAQTVNFAPASFSQFTGTGSGNLNLFTSIGGFELACFIFGFGAPLDYCAPDFSYDLQRPFTSTLTFTFTPPASPTQVPLPAAALIGLGLALAGLGRMAIGRRIG